MIIQEEAPKFQIIALDMELDHPSGKHKLTFTFKNNTFLSKELNIVYQLNTCRETEEVTLATHGVQKYSVYLKKSCVSNKKKTVAFFSELISKNELERSNQFSFTEIKNFHRKKRVVLRKHETYTEEFPHSWHYQFNDEGEISGTVVGTFNINITTPNEMYTRFHIKDLLELSLKKDLALAQVEWKAKDLSIKTSFLETSKYLTSVETLSSSKWGISIDAHSEYIPYEDVVKFDTINSERGIYLPQYQILSPLSIKLKLDFDFLYSLDYEVHIVLDKTKKAIGTNCKISKYCATITEFVWQSSNDGFLSINEDFFHDFLESGFSFRWFEERYGQKILE